MENNSHGKFTPKILSLSIDHNSYQTKVYEKVKNTKKAIIFPIFHYQGDAQYIDLIEPLVEKGYKVITVNLLSVGDKVLFFNYYYSVFETFYNDLSSKGLIDNCEITLLGVGIGANLVSYMQLTEITFSRMILISPVNKYKGEYSISREISRFKVPTFIFYGQFDKENSVDSRFAIYTKAKNNPKVTFSTYPCTGHYLYYHGPVAMELDPLYHNNNIAFDYYNAKLNERFFEHLLNDLEGKPNSKRICLITETFPLFSMGKGTSIEFLRKELSKLGYETYITGLWRKHEDFNKIPTSYIPIVANLSKEVNGNSNYVTLSGFNVTRNARLLAMFGFSYIHLYSEFQMSQVANELSKITGIKMPVTYHTLWKLYYEGKINKMIGNVSHSAAKQFIRSNTFKIAPVIITQSKKSYLIFKNESRFDKDIRVIPTPMNKDIFYFNKTDEINTEILRKEHQLKNKKIIGYVNKTSIEKNTYELISYVSRLSNEIKNLVLLIVGTGSATLSLKKYAKKMHIEDKVIFVENVTDEERKCYFHLFDAFVTGSDFELQGSPYFESAYCGTPIIAKEDEAIDGLFKDKKNAYIYKDFYQFAERIEKALFGKNKEIISNAKELTKEYSPDKWAKQMLKIYQEINK